MSVSKLAKKFAKRCGISIQREHAAISFNYRYAAYFLYFNRCFGMIRKLEGDIVECGVASGRSLMMFAFLIKDSGGGRHLYGFDSFEGFPEPSFEDRDDSPESRRRNVQKGQNKSPLNITWQFLLNNLTDMRGNRDEQFVNKHITLIKGYFNQTLLNYPGKQIALLHIDCDLYGAYLTVLETLYHRVVKGGLILFDEYNEKKFPGATKAIDSFFNKIDDSDYKFIYDETISKYYVVKMK
jgi:hypothetical protein